MQNTSSDSHTAPYNPLSAMQQVRPDLLGFVFHLSWLYLLMYSDAVVTTRGSSLVSAGDEPYLASVIMLALAMAVGIACTKRFMRV